MLHLIDLDLIIFEFKASIKGKIFNNKQTKNSFNRRWTKWSPCIFVFSFSVIRYTWMHGMSQYETSKFLVF